MRNHLTSHTGRHLSEDPWNLIISPDSYLFQSERTTFNCFSEVGLHCSNRFQIFRLVTLCPLIVYVFICVWVTDRSFCGRGRFFVETRLEEDVGKHYLIDFFTFNALIPTFSVFLLWRQIYLRLWTESSSDAVDDDISCSLRQHAPYTIRIVSEHK